MDEKNRPVTHAIYNVLGVDCNGNKDLLRFSKKRLASFYFYLLRFKVVN
jgi:hypothetical protein